MEALPPSTIVCCTRCVRTTYESIVPSWAAEEAAAVLLSQKYLLQTPVEVSLPSCPASLWAARCSYYLGVLHVTCPPCTLIRLVLAVVLAASPPELGCRGTRFEFESILSNYYVFMHVLHACYM